MHPSRYTSIILSGSGLRVALQHPNIPLHRRRSYYVRAWARRNTWSPMSDCQVSYYISRRACLRSEGIPGFPAISAFSPCTIFQRLHQRPRSVMSVTGALDWCEQRNLIHLQRG